MDLHIAHEFNCDPFALWVMLRDPTFQDELAAGAEIDREFLEDSPIHGGRLQRIRVTARKELPPVAAAATGVSRLSWVQESRTQDAALKLDWLIRPNVIPDRIRAQGTVHVERLSPDRCARIVKGVVEVNVPVVGRRIEQQIMTDLDRTYERAYKLIHQRLAARK